MTTQRTTARRSTRAANPYKRLATFFKLHPPDECHHSLWNILIMAFTESTIFDCTFEERLDILCFCQSIERMLKAAERINRDKTMIRELPNQSCMQAASGQPTWFPMPRLSDPYEVIEDFFARYTLQRYQTLKCALILVVLANSDVDASKEEYPYNMLSFFDQLDCLVKITSVFDSKGYIHRV